MATTASCAAAVASRGAPADLSFKRSQLLGPGCSGSSHLASWTTLTAPYTRSAPFRLDIVAKGKKLNVKEPFGPCGGAKFRKGVDAAGSKAKGKGVYQFSSKYGANVDGYSPIYAEEDWASSGGVYAGGQAGLALWALTFGALLVAGALLVYNTSSLV